MIHGWDGTTLKRSTSPFLSFRTRSGDFLPIISRLSRSTRQGGNILEMHQKCSPERRLGLPRSEEGAPISQSLASPYKAWRSRGEVARISHVSDLLHCSLIHCPWDTRELVKAIGHPIRLARMASFYLEQIDPLGKAEMRLLE